jgi:hypothetical protein
VVALRQIKYRINRVLTKLVAPVLPSPGKPGKPGRAAHAPTRSHVDAKRHIDIANIFLRQVGIELIPDNSTQVASPPPGNSQIGLAGLDHFVVAVTNGAGATAGSTVAGGFDVEVNDVSLTFLSDRTAAILQRSNGEGYFSSNARLLMQNGSPAALRLFESMVSDKSQPGKIRVESLHVGLVPRRHQESVLRMAGRMLGSNPERAIAVGVVESIFDYKQEWFGIESGMVKPAGWNGVSNAVGRRRSRSRTRHCGVATCRPTCARW